MIKDYGKLAKLTIESQTGGKPFEAMFNPESYSEKFVSVYKKKDTINSGIDEYVYIKSLPQDFRFKIIIDNTVISNYNGPYLPEKQIGSVYDQVNEFLRLTWYPENGKATPLKIQWGEFSCVCALKDVTINYTLFDREGSPVRAELDANFIGVLEQNEQYYQKRFKSSLKAVESSKGNGIVISAT